MTVTLRVGVPRSSPPLISECVSSQQISDGDQFRVCQKPGIYIELFEVLAQVMNVSLKWHLFDSNNDVNQWLREGKLDASARMKEQTALLNDSDLIACDYGLYEKIVYLMKRPSDMTPLNLLAPFDIWVWLKIVLLIFVIFAFMTYFSWYHKTSTPKPWSFVGNLLFDTFSIFVKQHDFDVIRSAGHLMFVLIVIHGYYFLTLCYEYFLLDSMVDVVRLDTSMTTDRFYDYVLRNNYHIISYSDSDSRYFRSLQSNESRSSSLINDLLFNKNRFLEVKNSDEAFSVLLNNSLNRRLMFPRELTKAKYFIEKNRGFMYLSVPEDPFSYSAFVFPRNSTYLKRCNEWMKMSNGVISRLITQYVAKDTTETYTEIGMKKLNFQHIISVICVWALGLVIALSGFLKELITVKKKGCITCHQSV